VKPLLTVIFSFCPTGKRPQNQAGSIEKAEKAVGIQESESETEKVDGRRTVLQRKASKQRCHPIRSPKKKDILLTLAGRK
jgi:hypothetical protein